MVFALVLLTTTVATMITTAAAATAISQLLDLATITPRIE